MILPILVFAIWAALLWILSKYKMHFFKFLVGTVGSFCFMMLVGQNTIQGYLQYGVTTVSGFFGGIFRLFNAYPEYAMITVYYRAEAISFFVDYECSGIVEMMVYISLLLFYPIYTATEKVKLFTMGVTYIFIANVIRVFVICGILKVLGPSFLFMSHTVFGRILFFFMMIIVYYHVFTRPHILRQKVGNLSDGK